MSNEVTHRVPRLARLALALYPAAWRARYGDEVLGLLADSGCGARQIASLAWRAIPARISPPRHPYDRPARMRASLASVLVAWAMLAGFGLPRGARRGDPASRRHVRRVVPGDHAGGICRRRRRCGWSGVRSAAPPAARTSRPPGG
jgi:hypothetical protein